MTTIDDVVSLQRNVGILSAPTILPPSTTAAADRRQESKTLQVALRNNTSSTTVYAYITGLDITTNAASVYLLQSDGITCYYPVSPKKIGSTLQANCAIRLGVPGSTVMVTIPQTAGGRIWFARDLPLTFLLNPGANGPGLVEPSVTNPADPNYNQYWDFSEFTFDQSQLFANISNVDFVCLPISLSLQTTTGSVTTVPGLPPNGLDAVCTGLLQQDALDQAGWSKLVVKSASGANLRALSPNSGMTMIPGLLANYYDAYVSAVWLRYSVQGATNLVVDTQSSAYGSVSGQIGASKLLNFASVGAFPPPSSQDIFSCSTGAFGYYSVNTVAMGVLTARLSAAFNRSTLLMDNNQPGNEVEASFYQNFVTNHYARICHATSIDGRGYAFPYDDVNPGNGADQAGIVKSGNPQLFTLTVGGSATAAHVKPRFTVPSTQRVRRALEWPLAGDEKITVASEQQSQQSPAAGSGGKDGVGYSPVAAWDVEKGPQLAMEMPLSPHQGTLPLSVLETRLRSLLPASLSGYAKARLAALEGTRAHAAAATALDVLGRLLMHGLSLSTSAVLSRAVFALLFLLIYFFVPGRTHYTAGVIQAER